MPDDRIPPATATVAHPSPPLRVRVSYLVTLFVWAAAIVLVLYFFGSARLILLGVLAAGCLAATLYPLSLRIPGPRWVGAVVTGLGAILVAAGLLTLISWLIAQPLREELKRLPQLRRQVNELLAGWSGRIGLEDPVTVEVALRQIRNFFGDGSEIVWTTAGIVSGVLIALVFIFIGSMYLLGEPRGRLITPLLTMLPPHRRPQLKGALDDLEPRLRWWTIGTMISMAVVGVASWIGYEIIGLEFAIPLALLAGLAEIVPTVGPAFAFIIALLLALTQGSGTALGVVVVYAVVQVLESYLLLPLVMKKAVKIPPVITLFSVVFWGKVFGPPGLLLALPINLLIWSFADHFLIRPRRADYEPGRDTHDPRPPPEHEDGDFAPARSSSKLS